MSTEEPALTTVNITILGTDYSIACAEQEVNALKESATLLDQKMREIRNRGKITNKERIAVMAALNITNDLLKSKQELDENQRVAEQELSRITQKVEVALNKARQMEL